LAANSPSFVEQLREVDPWRYVPTLFLPAAMREDVACLYCYAAELARIPRIVSDPGLGEIRLQWWREAVEGERAGEAAANPLSAALLAAIERHDLNAGTLARIAEARAFDLYHDPMGDRHTLEGWLGETHSVLFHETAVIGGAKRDEHLADAAGHAGVAYGSAMLLRELAGTRASGQVHLPADILSEAGLSMQDYASDPGQSHEEALALFCAFAGAHRSKALGAIGRLPGAARSAFLPLAIVAPVLKKAGKMGRDAFLRPVEPAPVVLQAACWKAALTGL
jgi:phytoene synthase